MTEEKEFRILHLRWGVLTSTYIRQLSPENRKGQPIAHAVRHGGEGAWTARRQTPSSGKEQGEGEGNGPLNFRHTLTNGRMMDDRTGQASPPTFAFVRYPHAPGTCRRARIRAMILRCRCTAPRSLPAGAEFASPPWLGRASRMSPCTSYQTNRSDGPRAGH